MSGNKSTLQRPGSIDVQRRDFKLFLALLHVQKRQRDHARWFFEGLRSHYSTVMLPRDVRPRTMDFDKAIQMLTGINRGATNLAHMFQEQQDIDVTEH